MTDRRVLVTGSGGFVGRHVVGRLADHDLEVVEVEHRWHDADQLRTLAAGATDCIHLGWYARPPDYLTAPEENLASFSSSLTLLEVLEEVGCRHLVVAGSAAEYTPNATVVDEGSPTAPPWLYGSLKVAFHDVLRHRLADGRMGLSWVRLFNVTGAGEHPDRLIPSARRAVLAGVPFDLSPGDQVRDFIDVDDVAGAFVHLLAHREAGTFNVSTGVETTLRAFLTGLAERLGDPTLLRFGARPYSPTENMFSVGANQRLRATGWAPGHDLLDLLDRLAEIGSDG